MFDFNLFAYTLILCSVITLTIKAVLPGGKKSALYSPMKFLLSLVLLFAVLSPFVSLVSDFSFPTQIKTAKESGNIETLTAEKLILEKSTQTIQTSVQTAFPSAEFSLEVLAGENYIPTGIIVICQDPILGKEICCFLEQNYSILSTHKTGKDEKIQ